MANGPHRITNGPFDPELYKSEHEVQDPELKVKTVNSLDLHHHYIIIFVQKLTEYCIVLNIVFTLNWYFVLDFTTKLCKP